MCQQFLAVVFLNCSKPSTCSSPSTINNPISNMSPGGSRRMGGTVSTPPKRQRRAFPDWCRLRFARSYARWWHGSLGADSLISLTAVGRRWWRDAVALSRRQNEEQRLFLHNQGQRLVSGGVGALWTHIVSTRRQLDHWKGLDAQSIDWQVALSNAGWQYVGILHMPLYNLGLWVQLPY